MSPLLRQFIDCARRVFRHPGSWSRPACAPRKPKRSGRGATGEGRPCGRCHTRWRPRRSRRAGAAARRRADPAPGGGPACAGCRRAAPLREAMAASAAAQERPRGPCPGLRRGHPRSLQGTYSSGGEAGADRWASPWSWRGRRPRASSPGTSPASIKERGGRCSWPVRCPSEIAGGLSPPVHLIFGAFDRRNRRAWPNRQSARRRNARAGRTRPAPGRASRSGVGASVNPKGLRLVARR